MKLENRWMIEAEFHKQMRNLVKRETKARSVIFKKTPQSLFLEVTLKDSKKFKFAVDQGLENLREYDYRKLIETVKGYTDGK